jgi:transposase
VILNALRQKKEITTFLTEQVAELASGSVVVLYIDQCHLLWDDARGYVWGPSAQRIEIPMTNFRERQTYYGAIEPLSGELIVVPTDTANGYWTTIFVEHLRQEYPEKRLILLWDGASYHRGVEMQDYLEGLNEGRSRDEWLVTCVIFAPNAPDQNPIEDVWLKAKEYVRKHWRECPTFQRVMHLFEEALNTLSFQFEKLRMYLPNLEII